MITQEQLEQEMVDRGVSRFNKSLNKAKKHGREDETQACNALRRNLLEKVHDGIHTAIATELQLAGVHNRAYKYIVKFEPIILAHYTLVAVLSGISQERKFANIATGLARILEDEYECGFLSSNDPGLYRQLVRQVSHYPEDYRKRDALKNALKKLDKKELQWEEAGDQLAFGSKLLEIAQIATKKFKIYEKRVSKTHSYKVLVATPEMDEWLKATNYRLSYMTPFHMPMQEKPVPWTSIYDGGYKSKSLSKLTTLIKTPNKGILEELNNNYDLTGVIEACNAIQNVPWEVNKEILKVAKTLWEEKSTLGNLPRQDMDIIMQKPEWAKVDYEKEEWKKLMTIPEKKKEYSEWRRDRDTKEDANMRLISKRIATLTKLNMAEKFKEGVIYFPHQYDWRGRIYPMCSGNSINPQSDDLGKALLKFHRGQRLGAEGVKELAVHLANCFGEDKVTLSERVKWVYEHNEAILDSAFFPLDGQMFWTTADKPFQALAVCFEWAGVNIMGEDYVSHIPCAVDGSNNGLQHLGLITRDEHVDVNIRPVEKPQDTYQTVADEVERILDRILENPKDQDEFDMANAWSGKITRSVIKQPVMTIAYGATHKGMADMIKKYCNDYAEKNSREYLKGVNRQQLPTYCSFLAHRVTEAIGKEIAGAVRAMDYMKYLAHNIADQGLPFRYTTPDGFHILQDYRKTSSKKVKIRWIGKQTFITLNKKLDSINKEKTKQGVSPNVVHALDGNMLREVARRLKEAGIEDMAFIHDSYAVHGGNINVLSNIIREVALDMYGDSNILMDLKEQVEGQFKFKEPLHNPPKLGKLDVSNILDAEYFFA